MKKILFSLILTLFFSALAYSQPNNMVSNTTTSFTLNSPCGLVLDGTYTVQLNYFSFAIGDWVPGPDNLTYTSYSNVVVTKDLNSGDVVYDFSNASPLPSFPVDMAESQGWIKVPSVNVQMNWDNHQLNCPALPVTLISFNASKSGCNVTLTFVTADEIDMTQYVIERNSTINGPLDMPVSYFTPHNDGLGHTYSFTDSYPLNGANIYRVKLSGLSGYVKYSNQILVNAPGCNAVHSAVNCSGISIAGPSEICSNIGDYSLTSNPSYTVNTWGWYSNDVSATMSTTYGPSTRVTRPNWHPDATVELRSFRTNCTFGTQYSYKLIQLGTGSMSGYYYPNNSFGTYTLYRETGGDNILGNGPNNIVRVDNPSGTQTWELTQSYSAGTPVTWSYDGYYLHINMPSSGYGWAEFKLTVPTSCGNAEIYFEFWTDYGYRLTPNPATSEIMITAPGKLSPGLSIPGKLRNKTLIASTIRQVIVVDRAGRVVMQKTYGPDTKEVHLNTSSLKPDFYIARIFDGKTWKVTKFIKK